MNSLVNTHEAIVKLCTFLRTSIEPDFCASSVRDLFAPRKDAKHLRVEVEVAFLSSPLPHRVPLYILLPHRVMRGTICLVTPSPEATFKGKILALSEDGHEVAQNVKRVIDTKNLRTKFVDPVSVRAFAKGFDNFILYAVKRYPTQFTGEFLGHQRLPVWVSNKGPLMTSLSNAAKTAVVPRRGNNAVTCCVGYTDLSDEQIEENLKAFVERFTKHPQGAPFKDILHIRVSGTNAKGVRVGLPIFGHTFTFPPAKTRKAKRLREDALAALDTVHESF